MRSIHVSAIEPLRLRSFAFLWRPVRHALDVESFGVNAYTQPDAGRELIEEHDETGGGAGKHQELYVVLAGRATFTVGVEEVDAPAGTLVFRADALLLAGDRAGALAAAAEGVERHPGNASARYNAACYASLAGETAQALAYLSRALELDPALAGTARTDPDLEALRTEPAYHALVARR